MDQGENGVKRGAKKQGEAAELELEVRNLRQQLDDTLAELDRRRHELTNWRLQLRRHWRALAVIGLVTAGALTWYVVRRRQRERPLGKLRRFRRALARVIDDPDAVAQRSPSVGREVLAAAAKPAAGGLVQRLTRR
jgi:hypothetical protein